MQLAEKPVAATGRTAPAIIVSIIKSSRALSLYSFSNAVFRPPVTYSRSGTAGLALHGDGGHFGSVAVADRQGLELVDDTNAVTAEDANELLGRKMSTASGHKLLIIDN